MSSLWRGCFAMRYLITGITGFAGPHLANLLVDEGHEVVGLIRGSNGREQDLRDVMDEAHFAQVRWHYGDLNDERSLAHLFAEVELNGVFHLAAQSHPPTSFQEPILTWETNVMGSMRLIQVLTDRQPRCRFMFCSTSEVYGDTGRQGILWEEGKILPSNPYGASKAAIDLYVQERCASGKLNGFVTRAFSHTGPRRGRNFSISSDAYHLARMVLGLEKSRILPVGNLKTQRVVTDVRDCVRAYYLLMKEAPTGGIYNVGGSRADVHEMGFFTEILIKLSGLRDVTTKVDPRYYRPIDIQVQIPDTGRLRGLTGWAPSIPIEVTLDDLLNYWLRKLKPA